jgi:large subunit ribosomal protein L24
MSQTPSKLIQKAVRAARNDVPQVRRAKINLARKRAKKAQTDAIDARQNREEQAQRMEKYFRKVNKEATQLYKDDWTLGPLAPRRDVGDHATTYGGIDATAYRLPERQANDYKPWYPISEGDRVVVIRGREKGKTGVVEEVDPSKEAVSVKNLNRHYVILPLSMRKEREQDLSPYSRPYLMKDVRLIYPLPDKKTGEFRDTIIDQLDYVPTVKTPFVGNAASKTAREIFDQDQKRGLRVIHGTNIAIPWIPTPAPDAELQASDTKPGERDEVTFEPSLLHGPMPLTVIDELRNKYGKFRSRPPGEAQARIAELAAQKEAREDRALALMTTPRQALAKLKAVKSEEAKTSRELNEKQLAKIGELVIQARQKTAGEEMRTS